MIMLDGKKVNIDYSHSATTKRHTIENLIKTETIFSLKMRVFQRVIGKNSFTGVLDLFYAWI